LRWLLLGVWLAFAVTVLAFATFEMFPALVVRPALARDGRYYQLESRYRADPRLAFVPAPGRQGGHYTTMGDQYSDHYGVAVDPIEMDTTYNEHGFRSNSSKPPYEILVIGDSFIEIGERDEYTLSELLKKESKRSTFNLGRAWYGPDQYVALFEEIAPKLKPHVAILCFFAGNDIDDIRMFAEWKDGGTYYDFPKANAGFVARYVRAMRDTGNFLKISVARWPAVQRARAMLGAALERTSAWADNGAPNRVDPDLALIEISGELVPMRMRYVDEPRSAEQLLATPEWKHLRALLARFRKIAVEQKIVPVVLYEPTHLQTYTEMVSPRSGEDFLRQYRRQKGYETAQRDALAALTNELDIKLVDPLPDFRRLAREGIRLYYPFDTHWTREGRRVAARVLVRELPGIVGPIPKPKKHR
jgi:hypothetical protein